MSGPSFLNFFRLLIAIFGLACGEPACAHNWQYAAGTATFAEDGSFSLDLRFDVPAYLLNDRPARVRDEDMNALIDGPEAELQRALTEARERFVHGFRVQAHSVESGIALVSFPRVDEIDQWKASGVQPRLPILLHLAATGRVAAGSAQVQFYFPEALGQVLLVVESPGDESQVTTVEGGQWTPALPLVLAPEQKETRKTLPGATVIGRYLVLGYEHILPKGLDHILFVVGLFLLSTRWTGLCWQVTAFTLAHSITLALALYGVVRLPSEIVEPLIAASIVFVGLENIFQERVTSWRLGLVFFFGLVHGLGFAGVLKGLGLPGQEFGVALIGFNLGVEFGQLSVLALLFATVGFFRQRPFYRRWIVLPGSLFISAIALYWTVQRLIGS